MPATLLPRSDQAEAEIQRATAQVNTKGRLVRRRAVCRDQFPIVGVAATTGEALDSVRSTEYDLLGPIRVASEVPGRSIDRSHLFTIPPGGSALELVLEVSPRPGSAAQVRPGRGSRVADARTVWRDGEPLDGDATELCA